jgi:hypothetical protein
VGCERRRADGGGFTASTFTPDPTNADLVQFSGALFDEGRDVAWPGTRRTARPSDGSTLTVTCEF